MEQFWCLEVVHNHINIHGSLTHALFLWYYTWDRTFLRWSYGHYIGISSDCHVFSNEFFKSKVVCCLNKNVSCTQLYMSQNICYLLFVFAYLIDYQYVILPINIEFSSQEVYQLHALEWKRSYTIFNKIVCSWVNVCVTPWLWKLSSWMLNGFHRKSGKQIKSMTIKILTKATNYTMGKQYTRCNKKKIWLGKFLCAEIVLSDV